jgi:hypothetical protein
MSIAGWLVMAEIRPFVSASCPSSVASSSQSFDDTPHHTPTRRLSAQLEEGLEDVDIVRQSLLDIVRQKAEDMDLIEKIQRVV